MMIRNRKFFRHYAYLLIIVCIGFLILTIILQSKTKQSFIEQNKMMLLEAGNLLVKTVDPAIMADQHQAQHYVTQATSESQFRITLIQPDGTVLADSSNDPGETGPHNLRPEIVAADRENPGVSMRFSSTEQKHFLYAAFLVYDEAGPEEKGFLRLSIPVEPAFEIAENLSATFIISGVLIFLSLTAVSLLSVQHINRAVAELRRAAEEYTKGNLDYKTYVDGPLEIALLSSTMNEMSFNLAKLMNTVMRKSDEQDVILASMSEAVILLDQHLCIRTVNRAGETLLGENLSDIADKGVLDVFRNTDLYQFASDILTGKALQETFISMYRIGVKKIESDVIYLQVHGSRIPLNSQSEYGVLLVLNDVTRLKLLERVRKEFIANVSHELKTPITSIKGFVETLRTTSIDDREKAEQFLSIIENQTDRLRFIIDDLLIISRLEQSPEIGIEKKQISVTTLVEDAVKACRIEAEEKNLDIVMKSNGDAQVVVNERLIEQAIINLLENAIKYSDKPGRIAITISLLPEQKKVEIAVADQGRGIPKSSIGRIFERFYRVDKARSREQGGTGLGLSIVKHIALVHGGEVQVESELGKGSTFSFYLPNSHNNLQ